MVNCCLCFVVFLFILVDSCCERKKEREIQIPLFRRRRSLAPRVLVSLLSSVRETLLTLVFVVEVVEVCCDFDSSIIVLRPPKTDSGTCFCSISMVGASSIDIWKTKQSTVKQIIFTISLSLSLCLVGTIKRKQNFVTFTLRTFGHLGFFSWYSSHVFVELNLFHVCYCCCRCHCRC